MVVMDRIDHVTIVVKDLEESEEFYSKGFGLKLIRSWEREGLKSKLFGKEGKALIELWKYSKHETAEHNKNKHEIGLNHIAFQVEDVESKIKELKNLGAKIIKNVQKGITVEKFALVEDQNGITIELVKLKNKKQ